jgi:hypothetical protein
MVCSGALSTSSYSQTGIELQLWAHWTLYLGLWLPSPRKQIASWWQYAVFKHLTCPVGLASCKQPNSASFVSPLTNQMTDTTLTLPYY